jgi:hypothetical protein
MHKKGCVLGKEKLLRGKIWLDYVSVAGIKTTLQYTIKTETGVIINPITFRGSVGIAMVKNTE